MSKRILIADDDAEMREEVSEILRSEGYEAWTAGDGMEAMRLIRQEGIPLVILDLKMPVMTGYDVLRQIKSENIPAKVVVVTASLMDVEYPGETGIVPAKEMEILNSAEAVIKKPFGIMRLLDTIKQIETT